MQRNLRYGRAVAGDAPERCRISHARWKYRLLFAEGARARPEFVSLVLGFLRIERGKRSREVDGSARKRALEGAARASERGERYMERTRVPAREGERTANTGKTAYHVCQPLCCENISSVDEPIQDARGLQDLVDALRWVGQLLFCVRQGGTRRLQSTCALPPGSQPPAAARTEQPATCSATRGQVRSGSAALVA